VFLPLFVASAAFYCERPLSYSTIADNRAIVIVNTIDGIIRPDINTEGMGNIIKRIKEIKHIDAFDSFQWAAQDLKRLNLLYGWNGSGKTTISRIFRFLERRSINLAGFSKIEFNLTLSSGSAKHTDVSAHSLNIRVFNEDFVRENLSFEDCRAKKIIMIGKEAIAKKEEITKREQAQSKRQNDLEALKVAQSKLPKLDTILTDVGRAVTKQFGNTPLANDEYYGRNYNRALVEKKLGDGTVAESNLKSLILGEEDIQIHRDTLKSERVKVSMKSSEMPDFSRLFTIANDLVNAKPAINDLGELKSDEKLVAWTETGYHIHKEREAASCLFCEKPLEEGFLKRLSTFFSDELQETKGKIDTTLKALEGLPKEDGITELDSGELFPDLAKVFLKAKSEIEASAKVIGATVANLEAQLNLKKSRLHDSSFTAEPVTYPGTEIASFNEAATVVNELIAQHNGRIDKGGERVRASAKAVELHTIASILLERDYFSKKNEAADLQAQICQLQGEFDNADSEIKTMKSSLQSVQIAIEKINGVLREFFGDKQLYLETVDLGKGEMGYTLKTRGKDAKYLSEGEKSILALIYFFIKLEEDGFQKQTCITVLDDPVDSQDSVFLFRTFGLLKRQLSNVGQLIILTHNFEFFNLIRDWFIGPHKKDDSGLYLLTLSRGAQRSVVVEDLPALLREYKSEYQYLFSRLYHYTNGTRLLEEPLVANVGRKLLEYFAGFKWSCKTTEQFTSIVLNRFAVDSDLSKQGVGDFVVKFLNEYSHGHDFSRSVAAPMMEAKAIAENTLAFIRLADPEHYMQLETLCS